MLFAYLTYARFLYERAQYRAAEVILDQACSILEEALAKNLHPGFGKYYVAWLTSDLYNNRGAIAYEKNGKDHGLYWFEKTKALRQSVSRPGNKYDDLWIMLSNGNIANSLISARRPEEALPLLEELIISTAFEDNKDLYFANICCCYQEVGMLDKAIEVGKRALELTVENHGPQSLKAAM
jgi:tetratricopeptide (TPR) repeat protein